MTARNIFHFLGRFFFYFAFLLLAPFFAALYFKYIANPLSHPQPHSVLAFLMTFLGCLMLSKILSFLGKKSQGRLYRKESILILILIWVLSPAVSSVPFLLSGTLLNPLQAYFECVSGFTSTGATILAGKHYDDEGKEEMISLTIPSQNPTTYQFWGNITPVKNDEGLIIAEGIEAVGKAVLFWRSFIQWIGGLGIAVLFIAVFPSLGIGGKQLISSEMSGPVETSLMPQIKDTASVLWKVYIFFTVIQIFLLKMTNEKMPWFDSITIALTTLSTGGFSIRNTSIGFYQNAATDWIVLCFMIIGSINFSIWYYIIKGKIYKAFDKELFIFFSILIAATLFTIFSLVGTRQQLLNGEAIENYSFAEAVRAAAFHIVSSSSSTGFATTNFDIWPAKVQSLMLILMYIGGMAGSTAGGIKILRNYILFKTAQFKLESLFNPESVRVLRTSNRPIGENVSARALIFFLILMALSGLSAFLFIIDGVDVESAISLVACEINNAGFGFRALGPMNSFAFLSDFGMLISCFIMIAGRLEFFALMTILTPNFWKKFK